jgi:hypothetical protein
MSIRVQPLPASDRAFVEHVRRALLQVHTDRERLPGDGIVARHEADLRHALRYIRSRYPDVWIRRQDPLASIDGIETWYVFRDAAVGSVERAPVERR